MFMKPERVWQPIKLFTSEEGGKAGNQNKADFEPSDPEKAISMTQAFNLLILILSIIGIG